MDSPEDPKERGDFIVRRTYEEKGQEPAPDLNCTLQSKLHFIKKVRMQIPFILCSWSIMR
jgi:hypothetical protein